MLFNGSTIQRWNYFKIHAVSLKLVLKYGAGCLKIWFMVAVSLKQLKLILA